LYGKNNLEIKNNLKGKNIISKSSIIENKKKEKWVVGKRRYIVY
jgi:hypothetical protein